jgi:hypothetical protein
MSDDKKDYEVIELGEKTKQLTTMAVKESERAAQEIQAAYVIAKKYPRNISVAYTNIINSCKRKRLAEKAVYAFPRGKEVITGASIRLAEVMAQNWGNLNFGIIELERSEKESVVESYCIDLETNVIQRKIFSVPHERYTKKEGNVRLTDPRDIYEHIANMGARRLRACILGIIPKDIEEDATNMCKKIAATPNAGDPPLLERVKKVVLAFDSIGVKVAMIEKRLGHGLDAITEEEMGELNTIGLSIKEGFSKREDWFEFEKKANSDLNDKFKE